MRFSRLVLLVWLACLGYSIVRYNVFGPVAVAQVPLFVVNKSLAFAGIVLLGMSLVAGPLARRNGHNETPVWSPRRLGTAGFVLAGLHSIISLLILDPTYFGKFFSAEGLMTWQLEASLLCGVLGVGVLMWQAWLSQSHRGAAATDAGRPLMPRMLGTAVIALTAGHAALMGYQGWLQPNTWHGGLPPITLLSFAVAIAALAAWAALRSRANPGEPEA